MERADKNKHTVKAVVHQPVRSTADKQYRGGRGGEGECGPFGHLEEGGPGELH